MAAGKILQQRRESFSSFTHTIVTRKPHNMSQQNYANHRQMVPGFHYVAFALGLAILVGSLVNLFTAAPENHYSAALITALIILVFLIAWYTRTFALKAQDRAIRAEENFRHYVLTGKPLDSRLRMSQIVALRFASDEEFVALAAKAAEEKLPADAIKKSITNWKADTYRV